ncbi:hypothetical protein RHMOL_Rhmol04G0033400 [Rhododendron molle]|uniref:Uncharacterized protein n=2 Tax=Rhododendron molle TaxID=49168 RepID=A0ACC0NYS5_RHOML|nr:hypothetical protein RHMOL_Rhmol04G0033400 [Rhododendron molle]KAI8557743.1 hypothetical protein RHMOL_Rhmol04G0033400 [Rhododendron molle]
MHVFSVEYNRHSRSGRSVHLCCRDDISAFTIDFLSCFADQVQRAIHGELQALIFRSYPWIFSPLNLSQKELVLSVPQS